MSIPIQEILEVVFAGTIFAALLLAFAAIVSGGRFRGLASPVTSFFFHVQDKPQGEQRTTATEKSPRQSDQLSTSLNKLKAWLIGLFVVSLVYSLGIVIERVSDELKDGPAKRLLVPRKTDVQIKHETFRKYFEDEWPDLECLPYSNAEIEQTYYTAVNFLKQREPPAQELITLLRRIHFIESLAVLAWFAFYPWVMITVALTLLTLTYRPRKKKKGIKEADLPFHDRSLVKRWAAIRFTPMFVMTAAFYVLFELANYAWCLNERKYDQLVFGYYLNKLELAAGPEGDLARAPASEYSSCPHQRLRGLPDTPRFDASGVAWLKLKVQWGGLILGNPFKGFLGRKPRFVVVNDKDSRLTIHSPDGKLKGKLELPKEYRDVMDLEEITWARGDDFYLLASHSTHKPEKIGKRQRLYRVQISAHYNLLSGKETYSIKDIEKIPLIKYLENTYLDNENTKCLRSGWKEPDRDCCGINIEGMAVSPDSRKLFFGFREPLICKDGKAYSPIYEMDLDRAEPSEGLSPVAYVPAILSDTTLPGPYRISGMTYDSKRKCYWILTSYEREDEVGKNRVPSPCDVSKVTAREVGGCLWKMEATLGKAPERPYSTTIFHKPEGIAVSEGGRIIIVFDDDNRGYTCLGVPYALFSLPDPPRLPRAPILRPCAPLLPRQQHRESQNIYKTYSLATVYDKR